MPTDQIEILAALRDKLADQRELATLRREVESLELENSWVGPYSEAYGEPIDRAEMLRDIGWGCGLWLLDDVNTRRDGDDRPILENEIQLSGYRARARLMCSEIPSAIAAYRNLQNYIIGTKWEYPVTARRLEDEGAKSVAAELKAVVDLILEKNRWIGRRDRKTFLRTIRDGESFTRIKLDPAGIPRFENVEPCLVTEPRNTGELNRWLGIEDRFQPSWKWGILTDQNEPETPLGYHVIWDGRGDVWDFYRPDELHHIKTGTDDGVKRGLTEFYPVRNHLPRADQVFQMVADGAKVQAAIAGVRQFPDKTTTGDIQALGASIRTSTRLQVSATGTREIDVVSFDRPKVLNAKGYDWKDGPMGSQRNPNLILAGQAVLRLTGARWNMPEWMTSGDASNGNYASSLVAESPFVKAAEAEQTFYGQEFVELIWKAVAAYLRNRPIGGIGNVAELRAICEIGSTPPAVASRDPLKEMQVHEAAQRMGVRSRQTIATQLGDDYEKERAQIEQEPPLPGVTPAPVAAMSGAIEGALGQAQLPEDVAAILKDIQREIREGWGG